MKNTGLKTVKGGNTSAPMVAKSSPKTTSSGKTSTHGGAAGHSPPSQEQIAARSFEIFLSRGGEPGHDLDDWFQALRELGG